MIKLTTIIAALALTGCASTRAEVGPDYVRIKGSTGGHVESTIRKYHEWTRRGKTIIVDGPIVSADAYAAFRSPNSCYTENAVFAPHAASFMGVIPDYKATDRLTARMPQPLQDAFRGSFNYYNWVTVANYDYEELKSIWPAGECSTSQKGKLK